MGEFKGTPGPWHVVEHVGGAPRYWIVQNPESWVKRVCAVPDYDDIGEVNARLIAAAPALFYALKSCIQRIERPELSPDANVVLEKARAAIASALGEA